MPARFCVDGSLPDGGDIDMILAADKFNNNGVAGDLHLAEHGDAELGDLAGQILFLEPAADIFDKAAGSFAPRLGFQRARQAAIGMRLKLDKIAIMWGLHGTDSNAFLRYVRSTLVVII